MRLLRFALALATAATIHLAGLALSPVVPLMVDPILIFVLYHSLASGPGWDIVGGAGAGLGHDALTGGVFGQLGLVDTVTAYVCARLRRHLVILRPWRLGLFFGLLALLQQTLLALVRFVLLNGVELVPIWSVAAKMVTTGVFGAFIFTLASRLKNRDPRHRRRSRKPTMDRPTMDPRR